MKGLPSLVLVLIVSALIFSCFGAAPVHAQSSGTYIVQPGDTLIGIAAHYGVTVSQLARANGLRWNSWVYVGQSLSIPDTQASPNTDYIVHRGDTLFGISRRFGTTVQAIMAANNLRSTTIYVGQQLLIPKKDSVLAIHNFEIVELQDVDSGKRITFSWSAAGVSARIVSGTRQRLQEWWVVPLSGTLTVEVRGTTYRNPDFTLEVCDSPVCYSGDESLQMISKSVQIEWACRLDYFFTPAPRRCPLRPVTFSWAAEQRFEHGRMIWLEYNDTIYVFYDDGPTCYPQHYPGPGHFERFEDTWTSDEPESDPTILPPQGLYQPIRGFGKVWRENQRVQEQLGWAIAPEQGFEGALQHEHHEGSSSGANEYLRTVDNAVIWCFGAYVGPWGFVTP